jgi:hypothetical protein
MDDYRTRAKRLPVPISTSINPSQSPHHLFSSFLLLNLTMVKAVVLGAAGLYSPSFNMAPILSDFGLKVGSANLWPFSSRQIPWSPRLLAPPITWHVLKNECFQLGLYDIVNTPGVAADLSHIATPAKVEGYLPPDDGLAKTLKGADVVIIPAGVPRKPGVRANPHICIYRRIELIHLFR